MDTVSMLQAEVHAVLTVNSRVRFNPKPARPCLGFSCSRSDKERTVKP